MPAEPWPRLPVVLTKAALIREPLLPWLPQKVVEVLGCGLLNRRCQGDVWVVGGQGAFVWIDGKEFHEWLGELRGAHFTEVVVDDFFLLDRDRRNVLEHREMVRIGTGVVVDILEISQEVVGSFAVMNHTSFDAGRQGLGRGRVDRRGRAIGMDCVIGADQRMESRCRHMRVGLPQPEWSPGRVPLRPPAGRVGSKCEDVRPPDRWIAEGCGHRRRHRDYKR